MGDMANMIRPSSVPKKSGGIAPGATGVVSPDPASHERARHP